MFNNLDMDFYDNLDPKEQALLVNEKLIEIDNYSILKNNAKINEEMNMKAKNISLTYSNYLQREKFCLYCFLWKSHDAHDFHIKNCTRKRFVSDYFYSKCFQCLGDHKKSDCPFNNDINKIKDGKCFRCYLPNKYKNILYHKEGTFGRKTCVLGESIKTILILLFRENSKFLLKSASLTNFQKKLDTQPDLSSDNKVMQFIDFLYTNDHSGVYVFVSLFAELVVGEDE